MSAFRPSAPPAAPGITPEQLAALATDAELALAIQHAMGLVPPDVTEAFDVLRIPENFVDAFVDAMPEYEMPGMTVKLYVLPPLRPTTRHILLNITSPDGDVWESGSDFTGIQLPDNFSGSITVQNTSIGQFTIGNSAWLSAFPKPDFPPNLSVWSDSNTRQELVYQTGGTDLSKYFLTAFKTSVQVQVPLQLMTPAHEGALPAGPLSAKLRPTYGSIYLNTVIVEGNTSDKALTITATERRSGVVGTVMQCVIPAYSRGGWASAWWSLVSGSLLADGGVDCDEKSVFTFTAAYATTPVTPASDVRICAKFKGSDAAAYNVLAA